MSRRLLLLLMWPTLCWGAASRDFDGVDDNLDAGDIAAIDNASSLSGTAWVYHETLTTDDAILTKCDSVCGAANGGFYFFRDDVGSASGRTDTYKIFIEEGGAGTDQGVLEGATNASPLTTWTFVAFTYTQNSSTGLRLYVNGVQDANSPATTANVTSINASTATLGVGRRNSDNAGPFDGEIAYARLWDGKVLSAVDINEVKWFPESIPENSTLHLPIWGSDSPELDLSGNARTGTVTGAAASSQGPPVSFGRGLPL